MLIPYVATTLLAGTGALDKVIKLWEVASGRELRTIAAHSGQIWSVAFSPDGKILASGSSDKVIKLWDVASGQEVLLPDKLPDWVRQYREAKLTIINGKMIRVEVEILRNLVLVDTATELPIAQ